MKCKAIINNTGRNNYECRCGNCGKLLFKFQRNISKEVDISEFFVTISARCSRSSCKTDNIVEMNFNIDIDSPK